VPDATRENVLAHERVNESVMRSHTVIPMSFGTVFKTSEDIVELLRGAYDAFTDVLGKMHDKLEYGLKLLWDRDVAIRGIEREDEEVRRLNTARVTRIRTPRGRLDAVELDADAALSDWIEARRLALRRLLARGTYVDDDDVEGLLRLSLPGVDELIGLVELTTLAGRRPYDDVVVDVAPTGHLLRVRHAP
jgi:gas vesicle protein GvpL/GvpF/anion-transporting ATPase